MVEANKFFQQLKLWYFSILCRRKKGGKKDPSTQKPNYIFWIFLQNGSYQLDGWLDPATISLKMRRVLASVWCRPDLEWYTFQYFFDNEASTKNIPVWSIYLDQSLAYTPVVATLTPFLPFSFSNKLKLPEKHARRGFFHESSLKNIYSHLS